MVDPELSKRNNRTGENADYYEVILVKNLFDESKMGQVRLHKKGYEKILIFVFLETKSDLNMLKRRLNTRNLDKEIK